VTEMLKTKNQLVPLLFTIAILMAGCANQSGSQQAGQSNKQAQSSPKPSRSPLTEFESRLQFVRNGNYTYIWVLSRKDGKPFDMVDGEFLRKNAPQVVDWVKADEQGTRFIAGTNFDLEQGSMELIKKRFVVEDYSNK